jgi:hypothetical protein
MGLNFPQRALSICSFNQHGGDPMSFGYALRRSPSLLKALLWLIALSLLAMGYAQSAAPVFPNPGKVSMSREDQRSLEMQAASEVYKTMPVLPDSSPETKYIRQLGQS